MLERKKEKGWGEVNDPVEARLSPWQPEINKRLTLGCQKSHNTNSCLAEVVGGWVGFNSDPNNFQNLCIKNLLLFPLLLLFLKIRQFCLGWLWLETGS